MRESIAVPNYKNIFTVIFLIYKSIYFLDNRTIEMIFSGTSETLAG